MPYAGATAPSQFLICNGQAISRDDYSDLFEVIGTTYGVGDGSTTFNIPNLESRVPVGKSSETEFNTLGKSGGSKTHTLSVGEMPSHSHKFGYTGGSADATGQPYANGKAIGHNPSNQYSDTGNTGSGSAHNNLQPYIVLNYIIRY